ncbi:hypothetical protein GGS21DRAFT_110439 [Xylaria nigripes]|nr:hypothetical protein GGS21DRAFT_110439 [Xylaria nigripes]
MPLLKACLQVACLVRSTISLPECSVSTHVMPSPALVAAALAGCSLLPGCAITTASFLPEVAPEPHADWKRCSIRALGFVHCE